MSGGSLNAPDWLQLIDDADIRAAILNASTFAATLRGGAPGSSVTNVGSGNESNPPGDLSRILSTLLGHVEDREHAVLDLARSLVESYGELNLIYDVLPSLAMQTDAQQVARLIVDEAARAVACPQIWLLLLDETGTRFSVAAAHGIAPGTIGSFRKVSPADAMPRSTPHAADGGADHAGRHDEPNVVRIPLAAQGRSLGVLAASDPDGGCVLNSHNLKLLEALASAGASALLSCRLHEANNRQMLATIEALASAVDAKDQCTHAHSRRVAELCAATAEELGGDPDLSQREIELSGLLHDIGKIGIPDGILGKTTSLTPAEYEIIKTHVSIGEGIVRRAGLDRVARVIRHHHERWDGRGYPDGLSGEQIPLGSRLIAVADTFDCLVSSRPYHDGEPAAAALEELHRCAGAQYDPRVIEAFVRVVDDLPTS